MKITRILSAKGKGVITILPNQTIREATIRLSEHNIGALVVAGPDKKPIGIISERDIVRHLIDTANLLSEPVSSIMTKNLITGMPDDDLKIVAGKMTEKRIRHLPVLENDQLVGMVSIGDVVKAQRDQYEGEVDTLQNQLLSNAA